MKTNRYGFTKLTASLMLFGCVLSAQADPLPADLAAAGVQPANIHVTGDTIYYHGNISTASTEVFKAAVNGVKRGEVTRMVISSVGGETRNGREIGQWVLDMGVIVEVDRVCFSSCANYIFPAGRARVIRTNAMVGWHGNERGMEIDTRKRGLSLAAKIRSMLPAEVLNGSPESIQGQVDEALASMRTSMQEEADFFARLGLRDAFSTCAVGDAASAKYPGLKDRKGWGFSIPDMERLGLVNTVYLGDGTYEKDSTFFRKYLGLLSADACWLLLSENQPKQ